MSAAPNEFPVLKTGERSLGIDLLRVISISLVILYHYGILGHFILSGLHGVAIFFMVSGFCMTYSTHNRSGKQFLEARFWRLIPTFLLCATLTEFIEFLLPEVRPDRVQGFGSYVQNLFCLPTGNLLCDAILDMVRGRAVHYTWVDGAYWSLLIEIRFYLLLWLLYYILKIKRTYWVIAALGLFASTDFSTPLISKSQDFLLYLSFFAFGMAYSAFTKKVKYSAFFVLLSFLIFTLNCYLPSDGVSMNLNREYYFSFALCFALFLIVMKLFSGDTNKYVSYFGVISYPIYLLHQDIGYIFIKLMNDYVPETFSIIVTIILILLLAAAVQALIDKHQRKLKEFLRRSIKPYLQAA